MDKHEKSKTHVGSAEGSDPVIDQFTASLIRRKARQLVGRAGFSRSDGEDIEQELRLKLIKHLSAFDPEQGTRRAFVATVVERCAATLLRDKSAEKRDHRRVCSLNIIIAEEGGPVEWGETIGLREHNARRGVQPRDDLELAQVLTDVADVIASMPPELRDLAESLKVGSLSQIARRMGVPRTTLNESVRRIRRRFERAGLKDYL